MKKLMAIIFCSLIVCGGCNWAVPATIKRETSLLNINIQTAMVEVAQIEANEKLSKEEKAAMVYEKSYRALKRAAPHSQNLDNYMQGKKSSEDSTSE